MINDYLRKFFLVSVNDTPYKMFLKDFSSNGKINWKYEYLYYWNDLISSKWLRSHNLRIFCNTVGTYSYTKITYINWSITSYPKQPDAKIMYSRDWLLLSVALSLFLLWCLHYSIRIFIQFVFKIVLQNAFHYNPFLLAIKCIFKVPYKSFKAN